MRLPPPARTACWGLLILALLQVLRPYYFFTDDNMTQMFPVWAEVGRDLLSGGNPFASQWLLGGDYPLIQDATYAICWHPLVLLVSLLADTGLRFAMIDIVASCQLLAAATLFHLMLQRLRQRGLQHLSRGMETVLSLSYAFSGYNLVVGSFWVFYLSNQVALPMYLLGCLHPDRRKGVAWVALGVALAFLGGVASSFVYTILAVSLFLAIYNLKGKVLIPWIGGGLAGTLLLLPLLLQLIPGFLSSSRFHIVENNPDCFYNIPIFTLLAGPFLSGFSAVATGNYGILGLNTAMTATIMGAAGSGCIFPACRSRIKNSSPMEIATLFALAASCLLVVRPMWLQAVFDHVPVLRSTRWPFREAFLVMFFLHLWLALKLDARHLKKPALWVLPGSLFLVMSLILAGPPMASPLELDRQLLITGEADRFWQERKATLPEDFITVPYLSRTQLLDTPDQIPYSLMGAKNFGAYFEVPSTAGYTSTAPQTTRNPLLLGGSIQTMGFYMEDDINSVPEMPGRTPVLIHPSSGSPDQVIFQRDASRQSYPIPANKN